MSEDQADTEKKSHAYGGDDVGEIVNGGTVNGRRGTDYVAVKEEEDDTESLYSLVCIMIGSILFPDSKTGDASLLQRIRNSVSEKLREASRKTSREILRWTRQGSPLRALLVITMGTIALLTTMALVVFALFFVAATANAIIISLLVSLAVAGGFLALFFLSLTAIYIGALSVAAFVISTATVSAVVCVLIASGWIGFFYAVWLGARGTLRLVKQVMGLAISGNGFNREVNIMDSSS
ncbi:hypothetical protein DY000_02018836 [Brassica cretica]|uniref:PGG domain-containing protein n=1 Tax=Brassica cretica TaxID=69181 RepID=A0ABQ7CM80_BRACR|nr:hypothetical protein DY000_02018836 [Brassica cretica]